MWTISLSGQGGQAGKPAALSAFFHAAVIGGSRYHNPLRTYLTLKLNDM